MKIVKNISVVGNFSDIDNRLDAVIANAHVKDGSVHLQYMGGDRLADGRIKADFKLKSDDSDKLNDACNSLEKDD